MRVLKLKGEISPGPTLTKSYRQQMFAVVQWRVVSPNLLYIYKYQN